MKTIAIIADYNPFHNGHQLQLKLAKEQYYADRIIIAMTGNFTQRGDPAVFSKHVRAEMALKCGADAVIEIPFGLATSGLDNFAMGAVSILNNIGSVDYLLFGSECGDIELINKLALSMQDDDTYRIIRSGMSKGISVDDCKKTRLNKYFKETEMDGVIDLIRKPNNILGILYLYNLVRLNSSIIPITHQRVGQDYLDEKIYDKEYASASSIRNQLQRGDNIESALKGVPECLWNYYRKPFARFLFFENVLEMIESVEELFETEEDIYELGREIIKCVSRESGGAYPAKFKRGCLHSLTKLTVDEMNQIIAGLNCIFINVIGCRDELIKNEIMICNTIRKMDEELISLQQDIERRADNLYNKLKGAIEVEG